MDRRIIKNRKAMSDIIIGIISVAIAVMVFVLAFPGAVDDLTKQINTKASIDKYLPDKVFANDEAVSKEVKVYAFDILDKILSDKSVSSATPKQLNEGVFLLVKRDILDENTILGFVEIAGENRLYTSKSANNMISSQSWESAQTSSATYYDTNLFDNDFDREKIRSYLEGKKFVVISNGNDKYDLPLFIHYVTGIDIE